MRAVHSRRTGDTNEDVVVMEVSCRSDLFGSICHGVGRHFAGSLLRHQFEGTETLVEHRASIEPPGRVVSPIGLVRISVELENVQDLLRNFAKALRIANKLCLRGQK
jgi:hypothetical protein